MDGDVSLYAHGPSLSDIYAGGILQQVVYALYRRILYGRAIQYSH